MSFLRSHTKENTVAKKQESEYDAYKNQEYTEADSTAVNFMKDTAEEFDPEPEYVTEYYVLWKTAGTNLPRWSGPFFTEDEIPILKTDNPKTLVLSRVVEKVP